MDTFINTYDQPTLSHKDIGNFNNQKNKKKKKTKSAVKHPQTKKNKRRQTNKRRRKKPNLGQGAFSAEFYQTCKEQSLFLLKVNTKRGNFPGSGKPN